MDHPFILNFQMIITDWYDGPAAGFLTRTSNQKNYAFFMIDWNSSHEIRVFGLQTLSEDPMERISELTNEEISKPEWFPKIFLTDLSTGNLWVETLLNSRELKTGAEAAMVWKSSERGIGRVKAIPSELRENAVYWFEGDIEHPIWFDFMGLERQ